MKTDNPFPTLVHFFGPDGSGKSTHVNLLVDVLRKRDVKAKKCWVRAHHTLAFVLWRLFIEIGFYRVVLNPFGVATKFPAVNRSRGLRYFWVIVEFLGVLPLIFSASISMWKGYVLVAERYILDTITAVAYSINDINFLRSPVSKLLLHFLPKNTAFIFLDSNFETIVARRVRQPYGKGSAYEIYGSLPTRAMDPQDFIEFQRAAYTILAKHFNSLVIDTSKSSIKETFDAIQQYLQLH